jgi:hypothetical protein
MPTSNPLHTRRRTVLAAAAVVLAGGVTGCGYTIGGQGEPTAGSRAATPEFSMLDDAGVKQILASKSMRLDFRRGTIAKSDVGLPGSAYGPDVLAPAGEKLTLSIKGNDGTLEAETNHVRFTTTDTSPDLDLVYYFLTTENLDDYVQLLRDGIRDYGLDADTTKLWIDDTLNNPGDKSSHSLGEGNKLGFNVGYDLRYDGGKKTQVIIVTVSAHP